MGKKVVMDREYELTSNSPDDPRLKKKWGYIAALPSEYLIHFRNGKINQRTSGQGSNCFKFLRDTVFIVPTSLKEIVFEANQLTKDNVDVRIRGMAVYRISDPLLIYKLINFSNRSSAEAKLARIIADMCRSTSKWLVSNMEVEECIRKRKEEIAESLKREVSRVVTAGEKPWGVEIVTIDIQDVYIQDGEIFNAMQMMFKSGKMKESQLAQLETQREVDMKQLDAEETLAERRKQNQLHKAKIEAEIKDEEIRLNRQSEEKQFELDRYRVEQNESICAYKWQKQLEKEKQQMELELEKVQKQVDARRVEHEEQVENLRAKIEVENQASPISLERDFMEKSLPIMAQVMANSMQNAKLHIYQQDGGKGATPFSFMLMELMQILRERLSHLKTNDE